MNRLITIVAAALILAAVGACAPAHINTSQVGNEGLFAIVCDPSDAEVYVDGQLVGLAKQFDGDRDHLMISSGTHILELRKEGFQPFKREVYSQRYVQSITVTLAPLPAAQ